MKLGIRPWGIRVSQTQTDGAVPGVVAVVEDLGDETRVGVRYGEGLIMSSIPVTRRYRPGLSVFLHFNEEDLNLFDPTTGERLSDGSYLVQVQRSKDEPLPQPLTLRIIEYRLDPQIAEPLAQLQRSRGRAPGGQRRSGVSPGHHLARSGHGSGQGGRRLLS